MHSLRSTSNSKRKRKKTEMVVRGKAKKKECKHVWVWLDCNEGLICTNEGCGAYSTNINDAPYGENKLLYIEMQNHRRKVEKLNIQISKLQIWCGVGWACVLTSMVYVALLRMTMEVPQ